MVKGGAGRTQDHSVSGPGIPIRCPDGSFQHAAVQDGQLPGIVVRAALHSLADLIRRAVESCPQYDPESLEILDCGVLETAIRAADRDARRGDIVILSPASASFDQFKNFLERGRFYKKIVKEL